MTPEFVSQVLSQALMATFWLCAPLLLIGFVVGAVVNILQIVTSLQDSAFSTIPRIAAFFLGALLLLPYMIRQVSTYSLTIFGDFSRYAK